MRAPYKPDRVILGDVVHRDPERADLVAVHGVVALVVVPGSAGNGARVFGKDVLVVKDSGRRKTFRN
jgi:hypothetical protein